MTSQQRADEWLAIWRQLRAMGYTPDQRERVIREAILDYHVDRIRAASTGLRRQRND